MANHAISIRWRSGVDGTAAGDQTSVKVTLPSRYDIDNVGSIKEQ